MNSRALHPAEQYEVDKERVRYISTLCIHDPNVERMFTHFVIGTQESRNARMRAYERVHGLCQPGESDVTAFEIASQETYIVQANRRLRTRYDEITVTTLPDGNVVGMYVTGEADVFTIRDVKHRGKLQVQLVPHLSSVRHTERRTWRLLTAQSTVEHLVWSHGEDTEIWQSEIWDLTPHETHGPVPQDRELRPLLPRDHRLHFTQGHGSGNETVDRNRNSTPCQCLLTHLFT